MSQPSHENFEKLRFVFRDIFEDESLTLQESMGPSDIPGWDSLSHVRLVVAIEEEFGVRFTTRDIAAFQQVSDALDVVVRRRAA